jgi:hypothetical protein
MTVKITGASVKRLLKAIESVQDWEGTEVGAAIEDIEAQLYQPTDRQLNLLKHALAMHNVNKGIWGCDNRFTCGMFQPEYDDWSEMVEKGLATIDSEGTTWITFSATEAGAIAAGLHKAGIKRAFKSE